MQLPPGQVQQPLSERERIETIGRYVIGGLTMLALIVYMYLRSTGALPQRSVTPISAPAKSLFFLLFLGSVLLGTLSMTCMYLRPPALRITIVALIVLLNLALAALCCLPNFGYTPVAGLSDMPMTYRILIASSALMSIRSLFMRPHQAS